MEKKLIEGFFLKENGEKLPLKASITVRKSKKSNDTKYVTIAIVNLNEFEKKYSLNKVYFQANFSIEALNGDPIFENFEDVGLDDLDEEESSLYLLHHLRENYSIGHGCSVNWSFDSNKKCNKIYTEILPVTEVRPIKSKTLPNITLNMKRFSKDLEFTFEQLENLINQYEKWLSDEKKYGQNLKNSIFRKASSRNIKHCYNILNRIKEGLKILKTDKNIQEAFLLMNKTDKINEKDHLLPLMEKLMAMYEFDEIIPISALKSRGIDQLESLVIKTLPVATYLFPEDQLTDKNSRFLAAEFVREKITRQMGDELPYEVNVVI